MQVEANGIEIEYESHGDDGAPAVLLVMGLGGQLTRWPMPLIAGLVERGYRAIRYDNRDVGLSTKFDAAGMPDLPRIAAATVGGGRPQVAYTLSDMAADAAGLLDALGIEAAHVIGASMGGMIAQMLAAHHPARVLSLTSIMSSTGNPALPRATEAAMAVLTTRPAGTDRDAILAHGVRAAQVIGSPGFPADEASLRERLLADLDRMHYPPGIARQMAAVTAGGDRRAALRSIVAPTMVIHGADDPLVPPAAAHDTAATIPGARLVEIAGMGHDLPLALVPVILDSFEEVARMPAAGA